MQMHRTCRSKIHWMYVIRIVGYIYSAFDIKTTTAGYTTGRKELEGA